MVAHGTASPAGSSTTAAVAAAVAAARPSVALSLCFLDVATPRLPDALAELPGPVIVVPLLLTTGYHVQSDIPACVAGRPDVLVARHLGPHPLLIDALVDRLPDGPGGVALVASGSSRPEASDELAAVAALLGDRIGQHVPVLTMADDLRARLGSLPAPRRVATYLLAEGRFVDALRSSAAGLAGVADPIGVHPALVELVWLRYDEALCAAGRDGPVG
jgi:sirohydrochlorin ferrochelatase